MEDPAPSTAGGLAPVAVVWCRQVDNEAESPGYTTIPDEFPGRHETLEAIRVIGNLTVNVADTHDYWDPDPSQPLSYYPNLFLYPAANGRYTCVGRMFLSTEDRPRLGMKTLVFTTAELVASGEFGPAVLRAHATMGGRSVPARVSAEPDASVYQTVGEGFLFHRGTTEPVVVVASEHWEAAAHVVLDLVRLLPTSLVALGAFLVFPYFLPEAKINMHEFTEQIPLALAVMRVPRGEAQGERHDKRIQSWESAPVALRNLTKLAQPKGKESLPLVLQYARDHLEQKVVEVARRVDLVEGNRTRAELHDAERQAGRDRRKEMWRIGTAMETAALLLTRPKGRSVPMSTEAAKRANEYLQAQPSIPVLRVPEAGPMPLPTVPTPGGPTNDAQHPPWLQRPAEIHLPPPGPVAVPVSVSDDPSVHSAVAPAAAPNVPSFAPPPPNPPPVPSPVSNVRPASLAPPNARPPPPPPPPAAAVVTEADLEARLKRLIDVRVEESLRSRPAPVDPAELEARLKRSIDVRFEESLRSKPAPADPAELEARLKRWIDVRFEESLRSRPAPVDPAELEARLRRSIDVRIEESLRSKPAPVDPAELEARLVNALEARIRESSEQATRALLNLRSEVGARIAAVESRPVVDPGEVSTGVERRVRAQVEPMFADVTEKVRQAVDATGELWATRLREELHQSLEEANARSASGAEELRAALAAQLDLELRETKEQGTTLREEVEGRVRDLLKDRATELDLRRGKEVRDLEQRLGILLDGRTKELEGRLMAAVGDQKEKLTSVVDERVGAAERRLSVEREVRVSELSESQTHSLANLQVRLQSYFEQKLRENQDREREKYVELLARLKGELEQSIGRSIDSPQFDSAVRERVAQSLATSRNEQGKLVAAAVADAELQLRGQSEENLLRLERVETKVQQRETELLRAERGIRSDVDDLDRRVQVLSDRVLPLVRRTWLKVEELEKGAPAGAATDLHVKELRREVLRELRRVEGELLEQTSELRDRLEGTVAHQGRIWLNLLKQLSSESDPMSGGVLPGARPPARPPRGTPDRADDDYLASDLSSPVAYSPFADDPPNPMSPTGSPSTSEDPEPRRRRRS